MRLSATPVLIALIYCATSGLAVPGIPSLIVTRSESSANAPDIVAGTTFNPRVQSFGTPVNPTPKNIVWCLLGARTYIHLDFTAIAATAVGSIELLLANSVRVCQEHMDGLGDGVIQSGRFYTRMMNGLSLELTNANNHQLTWGVAGAAIETMLDYMHSQNTYGQATMWIHDGINVVGRGVLAFNPQGGLGFAGP